MKRIYKARDFLIISKSQSPRREKIGEIGAYEDYIYSSLRIQGLIMHIYCW